MNGFVARFERALPRDPARGREAYRQRASSPRANEIPNFAWQLANRRFPHRSR